MARVFLDTSYFAAVIDEGDEHHDLAIESARSILSSREPVTSEMVLAELLGYFAEWPRTIRMRAADDVAKALRTFEVVAQTSRQFSQAFDLYRERPDKGWSLVDCSSVLVMQHRRIREVLTTDDHFRQAGFQSLLI